MKTLWKMKTPVEDESMGDEYSMTETECESQRSYHVGDKRKPGARPKSSEEQKWERLLRNIMYNMRRKVRESDNVTQLPEPLRDLIKQRYWSSQFATVSDPDATDLRKPDLVLMDFRLKKADKSWANVLTGIEMTKSELSEKTAQHIPVFLGVATKGYLILREQPWRRFVLLFSIANLKLRAHYFDRSGMIISQPIQVNLNPVRFVDVLNAVSLSDISYLGFDPTVHVCDELCSVPIHGLPKEIAGMILEERANILRKEVASMPAEAKGWVIDNDNHVYWIMAILWKSRCLFSRGTVCYRVQDKHGKEYALKDCWVDETSLEHEAKLLKMVEGVPNVVQLVKHWNVEYHGARDSTWTIRSHLPDPLVHSTKTHLRMLLTPCGLPLTSIKSVPELVDVCRDLVVGESLLYFVEVPRSDRCL
jgi:hypothetical protein